MNDALKTAYQNLKETTPLTHCLTNTVVQPLTANVLLAAGAAPAMVEMPEEAAVLASVANAVLINLGTINHPQVEGIRAAAAAAQESGTPWVMDPVAIGALPVRTALAKELLANKPTAVRGNASEIMALAGGEGGRGVDSTNSVDDATAVARELAREHGCVVAVSGPVDYITDGKRAITCANGDELLTLITGAGCSLGALVAAYCGANEDKLVATATAHAVVGVAAQMAAARCEGPGSFQVHWLDALSQVDGDVLAKEAKVEWVEQ
ncbi:MAG: hydroxyethylthiazole kinase [Actinomycetaceae bacterium]|nr:hydroxyethylthiazole kinase [Actinomycetaceae bacterium]